MRSTTFAFGIFCVGFIASAASADMISDNFTEGINPKLWTISTTESGYSETTSSSGVNLSGMIASAPGIENIKLTLNLGAVTAQGIISGDFSTQISFSNAVLTGSGLNQAELQTFYSDGSLFIDSVSNQGESSGLEAHVFNGSVQNYLAINSTSGTLTITRTGATLSGYYNGTLLFSESNSQNLTGLDFVLQNNNGTNPISISYTNFSASGTSIVPEPASIAGLSLGLLSIAFISRSRRGSRVPSR